MMVERPERAGLVLKKLCVERPIKIWPFAPIILKFLPNILEFNVSRYIQGNTLLRYIKNTKFMKFNIFLLRIVQKSMVKIEHSFTS